MERPQVHSETFAEMLTSEMDIEEHPIKVEPNQLDFLPDEEIASLLNLDLQSKQVKTEADDTLTSEIEIVEHPIKFEAGDQMYCLSQSVGMDGTEVTTEATDEMLTSKIEIDEFPIRFDPEELDCFDGDSTESSNNPENLQKCYQCLMEYQPKLFTWHTKNCHGSEAVVNIIKHGYIQHTYQCVLCKSAYKKLETAIDHLHLNHQLPNFPHHCKYCNKSFNLWKRLIKHQQSCSVRRNKLLNFVNCVQCDIRYANPELLAWHIENCHGENPIVRIERIGGNKISFQCVYCQESFKESCRIIEHLYRKHQLSNLPYCCNICNKQFVSKYCMTEHKLGCKTNSQAQRLLQIERTVNESLTSEVDIEGHQIKLKPGKIRLNTQNADGLRLQDVNKKYNKALKCYKCDINYAYPEILVWHIDHCHGPNAIIVATHRNNRVIFECVFCNCLFKKFELILRHLRLQHQFINLPFHCDNCDLKFIGRNYLLKHIRTCKKRQEAPSTHFDQQSLEGSPKIYVENQLVKAEPGTDKPNLFMQKMNGMEGTDVTTETTEELLTSEIEIVEHPIKFDSEELDSLQSDGTMQVENPSSKQGKTN